MLQKQQRIFVVFMAKVLLLTAKLEKGFQSFVLVIQHREMNPDQDAHQISM